MSDSTLTYYNQNAAIFTASTIQADLTEQYMSLFRYLKPGAFILDLGCGSGRDSKFFLDHGYSVEAVDGSPELCKIASEYLGRPVRQLMFQDLDYAEVFDAVWACASLLHVPKDALPSILIKINKALKSCGIFYASFKYGSFSGERNGRFFTDLVEQDLKEILEHSKRFQILDITITCDVRLGRSDEKWLNSIMRKRV